jgi:hypothetical protein
MENFNAKEYRDNLAKDLKEIRKTDPEKAQEILEEAQQTEEYQEAKRTHHENRENKEKLGELEYHPIFRGNALYNEMFPDVYPLFQAGEEPNAKVILQEILKHKGEQIVMDGTTESELRNLTAEDIAQIVPDAEIKYYQNGNIDVMSSLKPVFEKDNVVLSGNLDSKISKSQNEQFFSSEDAREIVSLIKNQVPTVNRVIIGLDTIDAHILSGTSDYRLKDLFKDDNELNKKKKEWQEMVSDQKSQNLLKEIDGILEDTERIKYFSSASYKEDVLKSILKKEEISFPSDLIQHRLYQEDEYKMNVDRLNTFISDLPTETQEKITLQLNERVKDGIRREKENALIPALMLSQEIKNNLGINPEFVAQYIDISSIDENTAIIYDRHNALSNKMKLEEKIPQQTILMPLDTGIHHAQKIGALKSVDGDFALSKRRLFEKK